MPESNGGEDKFLKIAFCIFDFFFAFMISRLLPLILLFDSASIMTGLFFPPFIKIGEKEIIPPSSSKTTSVSELIIKL